MRIAIFTDTFYPEINGVAQTLNRLMAYLQKQTIPVKIFAPVSNTCDSAAADIHRYQSLPFFLYPECRLAFPNLIEIKDQLKTFAPDIIHVATPFNIGLCGVYFAKKLNIPLVGSYHTDFNQYLQFYKFPFLSNLLWTYMNWFYRPCQKVFVPSSETLNQLKSHGFSNLDIWSRGVDCQLFHPFYDRKTVRKQYGIHKKHLIIFAGRLAPEKDLKTLLQAAKLLSAEMNEHIQWVVIGDGPLRNELQQEAPDNMYFTGYLTGESLAKIYSAADLFVFPSPSETFGNVVLEALASGTPAICANSGGVKSIIRDGLTGLLCMSGNALEFANAIIKLLDEEGLRKQMGENGRNYALTQKWESIFHHLLIQYYDVIEDAKGQKYA